MKKTFDYDLIILGSGPAGLAAAQAATESGQKLAIVESAKWGGSALNATDLPSRTLLNIAHSYFESLSSARFGISTQNLSFNYPKLQAWRNLATRRASANLLPDNLTCLSGFATFVSPFEIALGEQIIAAKNFIIATGSRLKTEQISGVNSATCLSPAEAYRLTRLPKSIFIVGAGASGCELANYFAELGVSVTLAESAARLLPKEDEEVGQLLHKYFESALKVKVLTQSRVLAIESSKHIVTDSPNNSSASFSLAPKKPIQKISYLRGGKEKTASAELVVLATGYVPLTDFGLENAGVKFTNSGIAADAYLRSSMRHICVAGDALGEESSPERAAYEGSLAVSNLFKRTKNLRNYEGFIRHTLTSPSVSTTGLTEDDCVRRGIKFRKSVLPLSAVPAANTFDFKLGFAKLIADPKGKVLGSTVVAPHSDLIIQEVSTAVRHQFSIEALASTPHLSSSWSELIHQVARTLVKA